MVFERAEKDACHEAVSRTIIANGCKEDSMKKLLVIGMVCALAAVAADDKAKSAEKKKPAGAAAMRCPSPRRSSGNCAI